MVDFNRLQGGIAKRLGVIGVPSYLISQIAGEVTKWVRCSGKEWTIERLKGLKVDLFRQKAGLPFISGWVRKNRRGEFSGPFGTLFRWASRSDENFRKGVQVLMVYSMFTFERVTEKQIAKFVSAVSESSASRLTPKFLFDFGKSIRDSFPLVSIDRGEDVSLLLFRGSPSKRLPGFSWQPSTEQSIGSIAQANYFYLEEHKALGRAFSSLYGPVLAGLNEHLWRIFEHPTDLFSPDRVYGGHIAFIQEPGGKLRSVASPYLVHQLALRHFGRSLYRVARTLPWDCTHDQSKPFRVVTDHLSRKLTVSSVDLSSATDHFPLSVQLVALKALFGKQPDIDLFEVLSKSTWRSPLGNIKWVKGQPLGLYPSFGAFTVTHGLLLWYLNGCQHNDDFYVVGDDVLILNPGLQDKYIQTLDEMGCPWSASKSITSCELAEFAGKVITEKGVIPQLKWREMSNDNFLDICRMLGPRSRTLLSPRQKAVFDKLKHCLLPMGLNFSFPGSDYARMLEITQETLPVQSSVIESLTGLSSVVNKNVFTSEFKNPSQLVDWQVVLGKLEAFDEKAREVLFDILGWHPVPLSGFAGVPDATGDDRLPVRESTTFGRLNTLERFERLLHLI